MDGIGRRSEKEKKRIKRSYLEVDMRVVDKTRQEYNTESPHSEERTFLCLQSLERLNNITVLQHTYYQATLYLYPCTHGSPVNIHDLNDHGGHGVGVEIF